MKGPKPSPRQTHPHLQRVLVRVGKSVASQVSAGRWKQFARYIERKGANPEGMSFSAEEEKIAAEPHLAQWQHTDPAFYTIVLAPNCHLEMRQFTRDFMESLSQDLHAPLTWLAGIHTNTAQTHVHIALRGLDSNGIELRITRNIREQMIKRAGEAATAQLGYRDTSQDRTKEPSRTHARTMGVERVLIPRIATQPKRSR